MYSAIQVATLFKIARETARKWAVEFEKYLSPTANPETGRQRAFTDSDLEIFALIAGMKSEGKLYSDIHAALANGQRATPPGSISEIVIADQPRAMQLQSKITHLESELIAALDKVKNLEGRLEQSEIQYERQLANANSRIERLIGELALLKAGKK